MCAPSDRACHAESHPAEVFFCKHDVSPVSFVRAAASVLSVHHALAQRHGGIAVDNASIELDRRRRTPCRRGAGSTAAARAS